MTPYNVAVADWFHEPEIKDIDLSGWNGQAGQTIRIEAVDDVQVKQVTVVITDETGTVLEQGAAVQADSLWWTYTTTKAASGRQADGLGGGLARAHCEDDEVTPSVRWVSIRWTNASYSTNSGTSPKCKLHLGEDKGGGGVAR